MTLFPRPFRAPRIHRVPPPPTPISRRILDARDLTNGINAVMIDCMHGVTPMDLRSSTSREPQWTVHESRAKTGQGPALGCVRACQLVSLNHLGVRSTTSSVRSLFLRFFARSKLDKLTGESVDGELQGLRSARAAFTAGGFEKSPNRYGDFRIEYLEDRRCSPATGRPPDFRRRYGPRRARICSTPRTARWPTWALVLSAFIKRTSRAAGTPANSQAKFPPSNSRTAWSGCSSRAWAETSASSSARSRTRACRSRLQVPITASWRLGTRKFAAYHRRAAPDAERPG